VGEGIAPEATGQLFHDARRSRFLQTLQQLRRWEDRYPGEEIDPELPPEDGGTGEDLPAARGEAFESAVDHVAYSLGECPQRELRRAEAVFTALAHEEPNDLVEIERIAAGLLPDRRHDGI